MKPHRNRAESRSLGPRLERIRTQDDLEMAPLWRAIHQEIAKENRIFEQMRIQEDLKMAPFWRAIRRENAKVDKMLRAMFQAQLREEGELFMSLRENGEAE